MNANHPATTPSEMRRLLNECKRHQVKLRISRKDEERGFAHLHVLRDGLTLASFRSFKAALDWLNPQRGVHGQ